MSQRSAKQRLTPPTSTSGDTAHLVASSILSLIPGAPELFQKLISPPLEKRQYAWMQKVADTLERIETNAGITLEGLADNEAFASVVLQATYVAIRNHHEEKRRALANCIYNAGTFPNTETDLQLSFVRYIDELSPSHIVLLQEINNRFDEIKSVHSYENLYQLLHTNIANTPTRDIFKMMCLELQGRGLIRISQHIDDFDGVYAVTSIITQSSNDDLPGVIISEVGQRFLAFISSENNDI